MGEDVLGRGCQQLGPGGALEALVLKALGTLHVAFRELSSAEVFGQYGRNEQQARKLAVHF